MADIKWKENIISKIDEINFLKSVELFAELPQYDLEKLVEQFDPVYVESGKALIKQGDKGDSLYIVLSGRLMVTRKDKHKESFLGEIGRGGIIGEIALLTGEPRGATVTAIRDSALLRLSQYSFESFISDSPLTIMPIVRTAIQRSISSKKSPQNAITTIAIAPAGDNKNYSEFAQILANELAKKSPTLYLNQANLNDYILKNNLEPLKENSINPELVQWLNQQEMEYSYIIYETDPNYSDWTRRCLRQADQIFLIANAKNQTTINEIEKTLFKQKHSDRKNIDLVLTHDSTIAYPTNTSNWVKDRNVRQVHHLKVKSAESIMRFIRFLNRKSICLVLNGAGGRSIAHIGVYKALTELGMPIDSIGGVSFSAIIACMIAEGLKAEEVALRLYSTLKEHSGNLLASEKNLLEVINTIFGKERYIEDLWIDFFCVASNVTRGNLEIFTKGSISSALSATAHLPGTMPGFINEKHEVLVDGGIMDNFPVEIAKIHNHGGLLIGSRVPTKNFNKGPTPTFLKNIFKSSEIQSANIETILNTIGLANIQLENKMMSKLDILIDIDAVEYNLADFQNNFMKLIEIGYNATMMHKDRIKALLS